MYAKALLVAAGLIWAPVLAVPGISNEIRARVDDGAPQRPQGRSAQPVEVEVEDEGEDAGAAAPPQEDPALPSTMLPSVISSRVSFTTLPTLPTLPTVSSLPAVTVSTSLHPISTTLPTIIVPTSLPTSVLSSLPIVSITSIRPPNSVPLPRLSSLLTAVSPECPLSFVTVTATNTLTLYVDSPVSSTLNVPTLPPLASLTTGGLPIASFNGSRPLSPTMFNRTTGGVAAPTLPTLSTLPSGNISVGVSVGASVGISASAANSTIAGFPTLPPVPSISVPTPFNSSSIPAVQPTGSLNSSVSPFPPLSTGGVLQSSLSLPTSMNGTVAPSVSVSASLPPLSFPTASFPTAPFPTAPFPTAPFPTASFPTVTAPTIHTPTVSISVSIPMVSIPTVSTATVSFPTITVPSLSVPSFSMTMSRSMMTRTSLSPQPPILSTPGLPVSSIPIPTLSPPPYPTAGLSTFRTSLPPLPTMPTLTTFPTSLVIATTVSPISTGVFTTLTTPSLSLPSLTGTVGPAAPSGVPSTGSLHCGIKGRAIGDYFLATYAWNRLNVPVTLEGCYQFCKAWMSAGCMSYSFYMEGGLGVPRCDLYAGVVAYEVVSIDPRQPYTWYDLACGNPGMLGWY